MSPKHSTLRRRTERMLRLLDREAPDVIVLREAQLIAEAAAEVAPEVWATQEAERAEQLRRRSLGLCEDCEGDPRSVPPDAIICRECDQDLDDRCAALGMAVPS